MTNTIEQAEKKLDEIAKDPRHWSRVIPMSFIILSLFALVLVPLLVKRHTDSLRLELRTIVEPAGTIADDIQSLLATELSLLIAFQVTEQPQYIRMYHEAVESERAAHRKLEPLARDIGGFVQSALDELKAAESEWHASIADSEFVRRPLPAPVFLARLFERLTLLQEAQAAARNLARAVESERELRRNQISRAEQVNVTVAIVLTVLALISALLVAWLGRQMRRLAEEADRQRMEARREAEEAKAARTLAESAEQRAAFLAEASRELSVSLDYSSIMEQVTRMAIPTLCDFCVIDVLDEEGNLRRVASAHRTETQRQLLIPSGEPDYAGLGPVRKALESGSAIVIEELAAEMKAAFASSTEAEQILAPREAVLAPLVTPQRVIGLMIFVFAESRRTFSKADLEFIVEFTRRVALAAENARLYAESQQAVRSREEILAIVSHDLRSPLTTITMTASMLAEMPPPEAELPQQFDVIRLSAKRMTRLIDDLLDVTTIDIGHRLPIEKSPVDLPELIDELAEIFRPQAAGRNVGLSWQVDVSPPTIPADRDRLNQALSNLVGNALKFTPEGGAVDVGVTDQGDEVQFSVRDDGLGIPAEHLQRIFDPYWQMKRTARMGAGLGLPIARGIVESHGGRIWVESDGTHGSTFRFTIPK